MRKKKAKYFYQGKFFDSEEDFLKWEKEWKSLNLDEETAERQLFLLIRDILFNLKIRGLQMTNGEFNSYLNRIFEFSMADLSSNFSVPYERLKIDENLGL